MGATSLTGFESIAGIQIAGTWGTAVAPTTGDRLNAEITVTDNPQTLTAREIGSGKSFPNDLAYGNRLPTFSITGDCGYGNNFDLICAQFFGTRLLALAEITPGQGDYDHLFGWNTTINAKYFTLAQLLDSATVRELPSCAVRSLTIQTNGIPGYLSYTAEGVANEVKVSGTTTSTTDLSNTTFLDTRVVTAKNTDYLRINAQGGASLSAGDALPVLSYSIQLTRPQTQVSELRGASGVSAPYAEGLPVGTLTVTLKDYNTTTWNWIAEYQNESLFKSDFTVNGPQIGTGYNRFFQIRTPSLKLSADPQYNVTSSGQNQVTLTFAVLQASSAPSGMNSQTRPLVNFVNTNSTDFLA